MANVRLGRTELVSPKNGFGGLPIQRLSMDEAYRLVRKAFDNGIVFYDTANSYSDSEEKLGYALRDIRDQVIIATKTKAATVEAFWKDLERSLELFNTDHIDLYQFHNPAVIPMPGDGTGMYEAMLEAKAQGKIDHIGISAHKIHVAYDAVNSGLYEAIQYPFSYLADEEEFKLVELCKQKDVGFIAMKGMAGGLLNNGRIAYAFMEQFDNVLPIWGIQKDAELDEFLSCIDNLPAFDDEAKAIIAKDQAELTGDFCRGCGYCKPCPMGIEINNCARVGLQIRRTKEAGYFTQAYQEKMEKVKDCIKCGQCMSRCPYGLNIPELLEKHYAEYQGYLAKHLAEL
ncbi:MAG: aldo/keto reductase [Clostridiales bacterium]|nr:aldo/keto reductase [Candidatus Crickella merdequi]